MATTTRGEGVRWQQQWEEKGYDGDNNGRRRGTMASLTMSVNNYTIIARIRAYILTNSSEIGTPDVHSNCILSILRSLPVYYKYPFGQNSIE